MRGRSIQNVNVNLTHATSQHDQRLHRRRERRRRRRHPVSGAGVDRSAQLGRAEPVVLRHSPACAARRPAQRDRQSADHRLLRGFARSARHQLRIGGDYPARLVQQPRSTRTRAARFTFTGALLVRRRGDRRTQPAPTSPISCSALPQQATLQVGGTTPSAPALRSTPTSRTTGRRARSSPSISGCATSWRCRTSKSTAGWPISTSTPDFTAVAPVTPGGVGPFTGAFPAGLLNTDANNLGPRLGVAYRVDPQHDSARRLQHHLQQRIVRVDRAAAGRAAAVRRHRNGHRHGRRRR